MWASGEVRGAVGLLSVFSFTFLEQCIAGFAAGPAQDTVPGAPWPAGTAGSAWQARAVLNSRASCRVSTGAGHSAFKHHSGSVDGKVISELGSQGWRRRGSGPGLRGQPPSCSPSDSDFPTWAGK